MFIIDNNLSYKIKKPLIPYFPGIIHVTDIIGNDSDDIQIWDIAKAKNLHILSKDRDFITIQTKNGFPPKILWMNIGNCKTKLVVSLLMQFKNEIHSFAKSVNIGILRIEM